MNISSVSNVFVDSIACVVPQKTIDNFSFATDTFKEDLSSTINALGVLKRHVCANRNTTALTLAVESAKELIDKQRLNVENIGAIVFVTLTPDSLMPNNASAAHELLGLPENCAAFDINHACSGYTYGLWISSLICNNTQKDVLLLDADTNSYYASSRDKATGLLFGDAGSATLLKYDKQYQGSIQFSFFTAGERREALTLPGFGFKHELTEESISYKTYEDGSIRRFIDMYMNGEDVFNYVVQKVPKNVRAFLDEIEMEPEEYKYLLLHQANAFMLRQLARKSGFTKEQLLFSLHEYGNTSSVSIPLTICHNRKEVADYGKSLLVGMGAGLSTGIVSIDLSALKHINLTEKDL